MWHVAVTVPASLAFASLCQHVVDAAGLNKLLIELCMAADAVVHDDLGTGILGHDCLALAVCDKISHMFHSVHGLETILHDEILMWHVAVVTCGTIRLVINTPMAGMAPRSIIRCHDMAVDTCGGVVAQVGMGTQQIEEQASQSEEHTTKEEQSHFVSV